MSETVPADAVATVDEVKTTERVFVKLSDHEMAEKAQRLSALGLEIFAIGDELEAAKAKAKAKQKEIDEEINAIYRAIRHGEQRSVTCLTLYNSPRPGRATCRRSDTLDSFERDMSKDEIQPRLTLETFKKDLADAAAELLPEVVTELQQAAATEIIAANADKDPPAPYDMSDSIGNEASTVLCDKCGHWHASTLAICPKCKGNLDADQVKARDFAAGWEIRAKESGWASLPPPWRATDELEEYDHLYRFDHSTEAFCGHIADDAERAKYKTQSGFPPDHYACPVCISKGHRILDKILEQGKPAKKAKAPKSPKASSSVNNPAAAFTVPEEPQPETQEET